eukprot:444588_1
MTAFDYKNGTIALSLIVNLLERQLQHNNYQELIHKIRSYEIDEAATDSNFKSRFHSMKNKSLYIKLDAFRSMLNPTNTNYKISTSLKYWKQCVNDKNNIDVDINIKRFKQKLSAWFDMDFLVFAQNTSQIPMHNGIFYAPLFGNNGIFVNKYTNEISIGILLMPPNIWYEPHFHPANEIYIPLNENDALWKSDYNIKVFDESFTNWTVYSIGEIVFHPTNIHHSMKTNNKPLLALYVWWGDIVTPSKLSCKL